MRNLRRFNENLEDSLDIVYIKHCFNDLVEYSYNEDSEPGEYRWSNKWDDEIKEDESLEIKKPTECVVFINCPQLGIKFTPDGYKGQISDFIEFNSDMNKFLLKLNGAINNLKDEYPNYIIDVIYEQPLLRGHQGYDYYGVNIKLK